VGPQRPIGHLDDRRIDGRTRGCLDRGTIGFETALDRDHRIVDRGRDIGRVEEALRKEGTRGHDRVLGDLIPLCDRVAGWQRGGCITDA
jgi:hypothetical protein